ncbi:uncharacterized protein METZ01_LOCUS229234, partial [marine metagenome]
DFGLAKAVTSDAASGSATTSATMSLTASATQMGMVIGTAAYMAPEQARGTPVNQGTDVWAFGAVLYEMLTGARLFTGETVSDTLASVLRSELDWNQLPSDTPRSIKRLLRRCLERNRTERLQHIGDARLEVRDALKAPFENRTDAPAWPASRPRWALAGGVVGVVLVTLIIGLVGWRLFGSELVAPRAQFHLSIDLPESTRLPAGAGTTISISPDGQSLVYVGDGVDGRQLYVRRMDELRSAPIPGTNGALMPFFSPDGEWIGFYLPPGQILRVPVSGGEPFVVCDECEEGSWGEDGDIIFSRNGTLWRVPEVGGEREVLVAPMPERGVDAMLRPTIIPGGSAVLFEIGSGQFGGVGVFSTERQDLLVVTDDGADPFYSPTGHILFARRNILFAAPFDVDAFEVTGPVAPVLQGVRVENGGALQALVSPEGFLVYAPAGEVTGTRLVWAGRDGTMEAVLEDWRVFYQPRLSPNGEQLVGEVTEQGNRDLW